MKNILAFEADQALAEDLRTRFAQYGCTVDVVDDGNVGLQKARAARPDLILLTIELPKMNGFSICNKLKKNPELKTIPLVILSSEATEDTFAQHRKLRTHAEDYLRKPFDFEDLLTKVGAFIELEAPQQGLESAAGAEEISVDTSSLDFVVEDDLNDDDPLSDGDVEAFTEEAFAALQMDEGVGEMIPDEAPAFEGNDQTVATDRPMDLFAGDVGAQPASTEHPTAPPPADAMSPDDGLSDPSLEEVATPPSGELSVPPSGEAIAPPSPSPPPVVAAPAPPPVVAPAASPPVVAPPAPPPSVDTSELEADNAELTQKIESLSDERDSLQTKANELRDSKSALEDEASTLNGRIQTFEAEKEQWTDEKHRLGLENGNLTDKVLLLEERLKKLEQGGPEAGAVSSREFLDLRELLNKKDRELLDYKDQINSKEKALLDQRERITSLERKIADNSDRLLVIEREREELREKLKATSDDKDLITRKLEGVEKRLESFSKDNDRLKGELEAEKAGRAADLEAAEQTRIQDLAGQKESLEGEAATALEASLTALRVELTDAHQSAIDQVQQEHATALQQAAEQKETALTEQRLRHEGALESKVAELEAARDQQISELEAKHTGEVEASAKSHAEDLRKLTQDKDGQLEAAKQEHAAAMEAATQRHDEATTTAKQEHAAATEAASLAHDEATAEAAKAHEQATIEATQAHEQATAEATQAHEQATAAATLAHNEATAAATLAHMGEVDGLKERISNLEATESELSAAKSSLESSLSDARERIGALDGELQQKAQRIEETDAKLAETQTFLGQRSQELTTTTGQLQTVVDWNAHNEGRAARALDKMRGDGEVIDKTKRALAIALTLLTDLEPHEDPGVPAESTSESV